MASVTALEVPVEGERDEAANGSEQAPEPDRRQEPRIRVTLDAQWRRFGLPEEGEGTSTVDVSHGGARIKAPNQIEVGDVLELAIQMPHGMELTLKGRVVQLSDQGSEPHAHVAFDSLSAPAADLLTELLQEQAGWSAAEEAARAALEEAPVSGALPPDTAALS